MGPSGVTTFGDGKIDPEYLRPTTGSVEHSKDRLLFGEEWRQYHCVALKKIGRA
jgi:hypothetical protein